MAPKRIKPGKIPTFKDRLVELRGNLTNVEFADMIGISRQTIGFYLNGDRIPDAEMLLKICTALNVSSDYLLGLSDVKSTDSDLQGACKYTGLTEESMNNITAHSFHAAELNDILSRDELPIIFDAMQEYKNTCSRIDAYLKQDTQTGTELKTLEKQFEYSYFELQDYIRLALASITHFDERRMQIMRHIYELALLNGVDYDDTDGFIDSILELRHKMRQ